MGKTIAEKILSIHSGKDVKANDLVIASIDHVMAHDGNGPLAISIFKKLKGKKVFDPSKVSFVLDHYAPCPNEKVAQIHDIIRRFAEEQGCGLFEVGSGICHQLMMESGKAKPGQIVIGSDSHTTTYGALNTFSTGVGSTDFAVAMLTGMMWFKVPESINIILTGKLSPGVTAKDAILNLAKIISADGATYKSMEFRGDFVESISLDERFTFSNMAVEVGAKAGIFEFDQKTASWFEEHEIELNSSPIFADKDAIYSKTIILDVSKLTPQVAKPHAVDNVVPVKEVEGLPINQANIGTCTNGRLSDLEAARKILKGKKVAPGIRLFVTPASKKIYLDALRLGIIADLTEAGAIIVTPGCGSCVGACNGIPGDGDKVISTANRNFRGRMGNSRAEIYLASPVTVAASALYGKITDPTTICEV